MSKQLERYTIKALTGKPENRLDKIRKFYMQEGVDLGNKAPIELTEDEERMRQILERSFALLIGNSETETRKILQADYNVTIPAARKYVTQAKELFGVMENLDKVVARVIQIERFEAIIKEVKEDKGVKGADKYQLIIKCQGYINKLKGLYDDNVIDPKELAKLLEIPVPVRTTDPNVLNIEAEDAEVVDE